MDGSYLVFDEQGILREHYRYHNNLLEGPYEAYSAKGKIFENGQYTKGKKREHFRFTQRMEILLKKSHILKDYWMGELVEFYPNGNFSTVCSYHRGLLHGTLKNIA